MILVAHSISPKRLKPKGGDQAQNLDTQRAGGAGPAIRALKAGAQAYMMKNLVHKELLQTIRAVYAGRKTMSPEVAAQVAAYAGDEALTAREIDVLRLITAGCANKEIAARLSITEETVKSRVKNILLKLGANDRTHATMIGLKRGIIEL